MKENDQPQSKPKVVAKVVIEVYDNGAIDCEHIAIVTNEETGRRRKVNGLPEIEFLKHLEECVGKDYARNAMIGKLNELFIKGTIDVIP